VVWKSGVQEGRVQFITTKYTLPKPSLAGMIANLLCWKREASIRFQFRTCGMGLSEGWKGSVCNNQACFSKTFPSRDDRQSTLVEKEEASACFQFRGCSMEEPSEGWKGSVHNHQARSTKTFPLAGMITNLLWWKRKRQVFAFNSEDAVWKSGAKEGRAQFVTTNKHALPKPSL
jgi:hypothetical protein